MRLTRPAALTALCAPWRRIRADEVLRRRRVLRQHHGRGPRRNRSSAADGRAQVRARRPAVSVHIALRLYARVASTGRAATDCGADVRSLWQARVSGSGRARTPRRCMQLGAAAAAGRRAPGAPAAVHRARVQARPGAASGCWQSRRVRSSWGAQRLQGRRGIILSRPGRQRAPWEIVGGRVR